MLQMVRCGPVRLIVRPEYSLLSLLAKVLAEYSSSKLLGLHSTNIL